MSIFRINLPDNLVTKHQLKLILTAEIRGESCRICNDSCMKCKQTIVEELDENGEVIEENNENVEAIEENNETIISDEPV